MRTPVKEPGPRPTTMASTSAMPNPASASAACTVFTSSTLAWRRHIWSRESICSPPVSRSVQRRAQTSISVEVSIATVRARLLFSVIFYSLVNLLSQLFCSRTVRL